MDVPGRSATLGLNHVDVTGVFYLRISNSSLQDPRFCFAAGAIRVDSLSELNQFVLIPYIFIEYTAHCP